jgi:hypothetical protein
MGPLMKFEKPGGRSPAGRSRALTIDLPKPARPGAALRPEAMSASELMFVFGAPLAHVVDYEEHQRASRREKAVRALVRSRRSFDRRGLTLPERLPSPV